MKALLKKIHSKVKRNIEIDLINSKSEVPVGTKMVYLSTIARSGTWFSFFLFEHFYAYLDKEFSVKKHHGFEHYPLLNFAKIHMHTTCPGFVDNYKDGYLDKYNALNVTSLFDSDYEYAKKNIHLFSPHLNPDVKIILLYRNPLDQVVSLYEHTIDHSDENLYKDGKYDTLHSFFWDIALDSYIKQFFSFHSMKQMFPNNVELFAYEDLYRDTEETLKRIYDFIEVDLNPETFTKAIEYAVEKASVKNVKKLEEKLGHSIANDQNKKEASHIRKGEPGEWKEHFSDEDVERVEKRFNEFGLSLDNFILS